MTTVILQELSSYFNIDPEDPLYQKELIRPAEIKEDVKLMEQRKRVTNIMRSKLFKKDLENIYRLNSFDDDIEGESTSTLSLADISEQLLLSALPKNKIEKLYQLSQKKGVICINDLHGGINAPYEQAERLSRCKLVSVFRLMDMYGWNSGFEMSLTTRPFRDKEQFIINPFGLMSHEITASSLLSLDFKGNILDYGSTVLEVHRTNWLIHSAIYSSHNETRAIFHLKTPAAIAVSSNEQGMLPMSAEAITLGDILILSRLADIEQNSASLNLLLADLKNYLNAVLTAVSRVLIMPNNGILICGETIEEAWHLLTNCQQACEIQMKIGNLEVDDLFIPEKYVRDNIFEQWRHSDIGGIETSTEPDKNLHSKWRIGELEFEALMRYLDNNGYRSGYFYHQENIYNDEMHVKPEQHKGRYEVEIPPSCISVANTSQHLSGSGSRPRGDSHSSLKLKNEKWFNTPNSYKQMEENGDNVNNLSFDLSGPQIEKKPVKWISAKKHNLSGPIPQRPVTAGAYVAFGDEVTKPDTSKNRVQPRINIKELKENQKRVKNKYYNDTNTAGPMSCLLDSGLSREEARRLKNLTLQKQIGRGGSVDDSITSASKGIIQRGHNALVYQDLYKPSNPFDNVTTDELDNYRMEVDRKLHPDRYNSYFTEENSLSKEEAPEIRITSSRSETSVLKNSLYEEESIPCDTGLMSESDMPNIEVVEKPATVSLAAPYCGTITSETSGADISHDELDKEGKAKKKKRRFKLPSFTKKKKSDKSAKN